MAKKILFTIACLYFFTADADAPGKRAMSDSKITFKNISKQSDYIFYWKDKYDSAQAFTIDSSFIIPGSGGTPMNAMVWGINKKTNTSTDTIFFSNYYAPDFIITLDTISNNRLLYSQAQVSNGNDDGYYTDSTGDKSGDSRSLIRNNIILFSVISLIALILLVWFFIRRKNKKLNS